MNGLDDLLHDISRTLGASMVLVAVVAAGMGMVGWLGSSMTHDERVAGACRLARDLSLGGAILGVTGGVIAVYWHWRSGAASLGGALAAEAAIVAIGVVFALFVRFVERRERDKAR